MSKIRKTNDNATDRSRGKRRHQVFPLSRRRGEASSRAYTPYISSILLGNYESGIYAVNRVEEFDLALWSAAGYDVITLDGRSIEGKQSFLRATATALRFPSYFGHNWDAFNDCIRDLGWSSARGYILVYHHSEQFARNAPEEWATAVTVLQTAIDDWRQNGRSLYVLLTGADVDVPRPIDRSKLLVASDASR